MLKIASLLLDIYDDAQGEIAATLPVDLHAVKLASQEEIEALPDHAFGLVLKTAGGILQRRFPLHDEESRKLSAAYFAQTKSRLPDEAVKVAERKFAAPESNEVAYVDCTTLTAPARGAKFAELHWGLTINNRGFFPLHDVELTKTAVLRYPAALSDLNVEERFLLAREISKRAEALGIQIPNDSPINLYTNPEPNFKALKVALAERKRCSDPAKISTLILDQLYEAAGCDIEAGEAESAYSVEYRQTKQAEMLAKLPADKIIGVLQQFDKLAGIGDQQYLRGMLDPYAALFKLSAYSSTMACVDGVDLSRVNVHDLKNYFEPDFIQEFEKNPSNAYRSLPDPLKAVIRQLAGKSNQPREGNGKPEANLGSGDPMLQLAPTLANGPSGTVF